MDQLLPVLALLILTVFVFQAGGRGAEATQTAFEGYFRGFRPDPWPHGVQEENRERPWGNDGRPTARGDTPRSLNDEDEADVRTLMQPPHIPVQPIREYRLESHI